MTDHGDGPVGILLDGSAQGCQSALPHLLRSLASRSSVEVTGRPPQVGPTLTDLVDRQTLPITLIDLTEVRLDNHFAAMGLSDHLGRVERALEVARIHGGQLEMGQLVRCMESLALAFCRESDVRVALCALVDVPFRCAVAN